LSKRPFSLPPELAQAAEEMAREEGKTLKGNLVQGCEKYGIY